MKSSYAGVYNFIITNKSDIEKKQWETYLSFEATKIQTQKFKDLQSTLPDGKASPRTKMPQFNFQY